METQVEISQKQGRSPFISTNFSPRQGVGWLFSTPVSNRPFLEPVKEEFFITEGGEVIRQWRDNINAPLSREIVRAWLVFKLVKILPLKKEIKSALKNERLLTNKADDFIAVIRCCLDNYRQLIEDTLKNEIADFAESSHPLIAFFTLRDNDIIESIQYCLDRLFPAEKDALRKFAEKYRDELMTIKVVRSFRLIRAD